MKFENTLPEGFRKKCETEIGRTKPLKSAGSAFGKKTLGETPESKVEHFFADEWAPRRGIRILAKEALALAIGAGGVYTPDFLIATEAGIALVEVKSENPLPNEERGILAFTEASRRNPQIDFWWARQTGAAFDVKIFRGGSCA